jgi:CheY-like chemotaxis protein
MSEPPAGAGIVLSDDLMFASRITGTARSLGLTIRPARTVEILQQLAGQQCPACVILDLGHPGLRLTDLLGWLRATCTPPPRIVSYGSHVDTETLRAAREAGCDLVLPRSRFVQDLPQQLPQWLNAASS